MSLHGVRWLGIWMACTLVFAGCSTLRVSEAERVPPEIARLEKAAKSGDPTALSRLAFVYQEGRGMPVDHERAIELHQQAANQGEVASQAALGQYFITGMGGTEKRPQKALYRLRQAANAGNPDAQALLGATYLHGFGQGPMAILPNLTKARIWLEAASDQGVAQADYDLATYYGGLQDYEQTLERLEKAVAQDHPQAHTFLSAIYENGYGVAVDDAESVRLLRRAAILGDPVAQTYLGVALREGSRMTPNARESFEWFEKAAAQGYTDGLVNLGIAYVKGTGVSRDVVRGVAWLEIGRARHSRNAIRALSSVRAELTPEQLEAARELQGKLAVGLPEYVE